MDRDLAAHPATMLVCICGATAESGADFCGACGEPLDHATPTGPRTETEPDDRHAGHAGSASSNGGGDGDGSSDSGGADPPPGAGGGSSTSDGGGPAAWQPFLQPIQPPATRRRTQQPDRRPQPGDVVCGFCGSGNKPVRNFCRSCGHSLADAEEVPPLPWWRRVFRSQPRTLPVAGERRPDRRMRFPTRFVVFVVVLAVIAAAAWITRDALRSGYDAVVDRVSGAVPIEPASIDASSEAPDHAAALARDGVNNRSWAPAAAGDGVGEFLVATFAEPFRLVSVVITSGASTEPAAFLAAGRPQKLLFTMTDAAGHETTDEVTLDDTAGAQSARVVADDVVRVQVTIASAYPVPAGQRVAIAEIEFKSRA